MFAEYRKLQRFCAAQHALANYRAAITRQWSLVRTQHRPLRKSVVLQAKYEGIVQQHDSDHTISTYGRGLDYFGSLSVCRNLELLPIL